MEPSRGILGGPSKGGKMTCICWLRGSRAVVPPERALNQEPGFKSLSTVSPG